MDMNNYILDIELHVDVKRPKEVVFEGMLEEITTKMRYPDGRSMDHKLERWPGGRWYRDLGENTGHLWGHVQTFKPPVLLEIVGPMFMSYPVAGYVSWSVSDVEGGSRLTLRHRAFGLIEEAHRQGVRQGWGAMLDEIKKDLEG